MIVYGGNKDWMDSTLLYVVTLVYTLMCAPSQQHFWNSQYNI